MSIINFTNCKLSNKYLKSSGFTLIEIILSIFILAVIAAISSGVYSNFIRQSSLDIASSEIVSILREVQSKSQSSTDGYAWGVYFDDINKDRYNVFVGNCSNDSTVSCRVSADCAGNACSMIDKETYYIPKSVEISSASFGSGSYILFDRPTGKAKSSFGGNVVVQLKNGGAVNTISVSALGIIQ